MKNIFSLQHFVTSFGAIAILVVNIGLVHARDVSDQHLDAAKKMIKAVHATDQFDSFLPIAARDLKNELIGNDPHLATTISDIVDKQALALAKRRADLEKEIAHVYVKHFSQEELDKITIFYNSDAGKKFLKEVPSIARDSYAVFDMWRSSIVKDLMKNVEGEMSKTLNLDKSATPMKLPL
ncbi:hypothetical protein X471_00414 [Bartonella bacilliformis str. Heidi Mejia]|uniref:DUF2059 domain-containing protein n=2 Tax=Bartonella bacilliformis TaxID=774 RepID=A1USF8_BARBK|nr:DUF2059 domain-containing protein [Bartonella bacilliformis]ABM44599.1 conserved hypothetical protein [Bartonella bacilliformis KC583]AMG85731.1 DUF2059 domain-containing protein [Bartonella bacilliformis]EKS44832.1 hypothetical protein BbINS_02833 [Bartonella bacilliformis INS]EYS89796.1 hypothetical protein X472_00235 [Bartonella bacilliformis San Pedro600-02]EYS92122.1 hypothetical protein X471_00414 [Bartonella bacilliformis str. Heidi Mejia]